MSKKRQDDPRSEFKSSWNNLWNAAKTAAVPEVMKALERFHAASVALSLSRPETSRHDGMLAMSGWQGRTDDGPRCRSCGLPMPHEKTS